MLINRLQNMRIPYPYLTSFQAVNTFWAGQSRFILVTVSRKKCCEMMLEKTTLLL